ncbi:venom serine protease-like [Culicoides brevitarsis]|uniref:venom serine protease-like n=1 Tax=Culicoides brevitarsis TaxID=469753 RepID=UPI00307B52F3
MIKFLFIIGLTILTQHKDADAWLLPCDETIELKAGDNITLKSPNNPVGSAGSLCRYKIKAPQGFTITATCKLKIHQDDNGKCSSESFHVMKNGSTDLMGSEIICGKGKITRTSRFNELTLAYKSEINTGKFSCSITTNCDCGWSVKSKVVNGEIAEVNEFISMAGIVNILTRTVECGSSIISPFYALTAAHCFKGSISMENNVALLVGDHDHSVGNDTSFAALYLIEKITRHEDYNSVTYANDIALMKTKKEIKFNIAVGPACLPYGFAPNHFDENFIVEAAGWGSIEKSFRGKRSEVLRTVELNTLNIETCKKHWPNITPNQVCTFTEGKDTCSGDSGGNLYYRNNKLYTILIVSFGGECASKVPAVNTKISAYLPWIEENTEGAFFCKA